MPGFNGSVRVMAIAWSKTQGRLGRSDGDRARSGRRDRRRCRASSTSRRPLADSCRHRQCRGRGRRLPARSRHPRPAHRRRRRAEPDGEARRASARLASTMPIAAAGVGTAALDLKITGPGFTADAALRARRRGRRARRLSPRRPAAGGRAQARRSPTTLLADFVPGTGSVSVAASPFGALDAPALLQALDRYPYGCSEQTVSRAMPLLYVNQLAIARTSRRSIPISTGASRHAIEREMTRQSSNGAFGLWAADSDDDDLWLDAFVTDFLTRARERNFAVPQLGFDLALDHLRNTVVNADRPRRRRGRAARLCALRAGAQRPAGRSAICAISPTPSSAIFKTPLAQGADRGGAGDAGRPRARRQGVRGRARRAGGRAGQRLVAPRLRLDAARRGGGAGAGRRSQSDRRRIARRPDRTRRRGARQRARGAASTPARRRTTGWCSPPRRWPSTRR